MAPPTSYDVPPAAPPGPAWAAPAPSPAAAPPWQQADPQAPWAAARPARPRGVNPFADAPLTDFARDAGAAVLLFASLALPWDLRNDAADRWWVVVSVLLAVVALALPYLAASRVVPGFGPHQSQLTKIALTAPVLISAAAALVYELLQVADDDSVPGLLGQADFRDGGLGSAVTVAIAGALLAVAPRRSEEPADFRDDRTWWRLAGLVGVTAVVVVSAVFVAGFIRLLTADYVEVEALLLVFLVVLWGCSLVLVAGPVPGLLSRDVAWARVAATVGLSVAVVAVLGADGDDAGDSFLSVTPVETWDVLYGGSFAIAAVGALALARSVQRLGDPRLVARSWVATASDAALLAAAAQGVLALVILLQLLIVEEADASAIATMVATLVSVASLVTGRAGLGGLPSSRIRVVAAFALALVSAVIASIVYSSVETATGIGGLGVAAWLSLPALALFSLLAPPSVRQAMGPLMPDRVGVQYSTVVGHQPTDAGAWAQPQQAPHPQQPGSWQQPASATPATPPAPPATPTPPTAPAQQAPPTA